MMHARWVLLSMASLLAAAGCDNAECTGAACPQDAGPDSGPPDAGPPPPDSGMPMQDAGPCLPYVDTNECIAQASCPAADTVQLDLTTVTSLLIDPSGNTEIVDIVPGSDTRAIAINALSNVLVELAYSATSITLVRTVFLVTGSDSAVTTSVKAAPNGQYAAVTVAETDCTDDRVLFVDITDSANFGAVLGQVPVGYAPDATAFSHDGAYLVVADEGDNDFPCDVTLGGSVTIVDLSGGPGAATVAQTIPVTHAATSEPEGVAISADGTVIIPIQDTSELGFFSLSDVPTATITFISVAGEPPVATEPDGIAISDTGRWAAVGLEEDDRLAIVDIANRTVVQDYDILAAGDVPGDYPSDTRTEPRADLEPEQLVFFRQRGALFIVVTLQESNAAIAYRVDETTGALTFDSIDRLGVQPLAVDPLNGRGTIRAEGIAVNPRAGLFLTANEGEGSVTLLRSAATMPRDCP